MTTTETSPRTVAVTGANGMVGQHLIGLLLERGDRVIALVRDPEHAQLPDGVEGRRWQASDPAAPLQGADAVVNLVGPPIFAQPWTDARKRELAEVRMEAVRSIIEGIRQTQNTVKTFLSSSAVEYGGDTGDQITDETVGPGHGFLAEMAQQWEAAALEAAQTGLRVALMRHGLVLGREGGTFAALLPIFQRGFGGTLGRSNTWVSWIHVDDDVRLALHVLDHEELSGPVVFAAPNPATQGEFAHAFGRALDRPAVLPMPPFALRLMYGERAELFLDSHRAMPRQALDSGFGFSFPAIEAALRDLTRGEAGNASSGRTASRWRSSTRHFAPEKDTIMTSTPLVLLTLTHTLVVLATLGVGVVYGTDVFFAAIGRRALAGASDASLTDVMGRLHEYGDARMPFFAVTGMFSTLGLVFAAHLGTAASGLAWLLSSP